MQEASLPMLRSGAAPPVKSCGWGDGSLQVDHKPSTTDKSQAKAGCVQQASSGLVSHSPEALQGFQGSQDPAALASRVWGALRHGEDEKPSLTPLPMELCSGGGNSGPRSSTPRKQPGSALSHSKHRRLMVLAVLTPSGPAWGEVQGLHPRDLQSTKTP